MRRRIFFMSLSLLLLFCLSITSLCIADTIIKSDGSRVKGKIVKEDQDFVWVKTPYGTIKVDRYDIDRIERGEEEKPAKPEPQKTEPEKTEPEEVEKPAVEKVEKPAEKTKPAKKEEPEAQSASGNDELLGEKNLKKLKEVCKDRMKAYEGVPWASAHTDTVEANGRRVFALKCNSTKKVTKHYKWLLGKLYSKYCDVFAAFSPAARTCNIEIHKNYSEFRSMRQKPVGVGGYYMPGRYQLVGFHGIMGTLSTDSILAHEGCHLFQDLIGMFGRGGGCPIWVTEGMAVLMEAAKIGKDGKIHIRGVSPDRLTHLQNMIKGGNPIPLATLMSTPQRSFSAKHYAHAGMFTFWLIKGAKKKSLAYLYNDYIKIATGGTTSTGQSLRGRRIQGGDFQKLCSQRKLSLSTLEEKWKKWVLKQKIERPGKASGNKFICDDYGLVVSSPGKGWKIETEETHGSLCMMTHKKIKGYIFVSVSGTFGTPDLDEFFAMVDQMRERSQQKLERYRRISREIKKYMKGTLDGYESVSEYADPESPITKEFQRRRAVCMSMVDVRYTVSCMADPDTYDAFQEHFNKVSNSLRIDGSKLD